MNYYQEYWPRPAGRDLSLGVYWMNSIAQCANPLCQKSWLRFCNLKLSRIVYLERNLSPSCQRFHKGYSCQQTRSSSWVARDTFQCSTFFCSELFEQTPSRKWLELHCSLSHISIKLLVVLVACIYIKLANDIEPYFHSMSISIFPPACISNHLLTSYHSGNLQS